MKLLSINYPKQQEDNDKITDLNQKYKMYLAKVTKAESRMIRLPSPEREGEVQPPHKAPTGVQLKQLFSRSWVLARRDPRLSRAKILNTTVIGLLMMGAFWQINNFSTMTDV